MFADDICVFVRARELQSMLVYAEIAWKFFNCSKTVCRLRLRVQKAVIPLLTLGCQNGKAVKHYKYLGIVLDTELSDDKDIQRQLRSVSLFFPGFKFS